MKKREKKKIGTPRTGIVSDVSTKFENLRGTATPFRIFSFLDAFRYLKLF